jgi:Holliday junction resolvase
MGQPHPTRIAAETSDVLYRVKRGLSGYVSYLAACEMNESFSEYVLYEPILRILTARGYTVKFEVECPGINQPDRGDRKRLDLVAEKGAVKFAMEIKWKKEPALNVGKDVAKLQAFLGANPEARSFLCIFGRRSHIEHLRLERFRDRGAAVFADFGRTKYGCRVFEMPQRN